MMEMSILRLAISFHRRGSRHWRSGVWRYNDQYVYVGNITPVLPKRRKSTSSFVGIGVDAESPGTLVVTTFDHYSSGDFIFRTTNANATTPTWVSLYGGTSTRNTTLSPYMQPFTDGIGNWAATAAIDPFNPAHIVFGTGQGLWTTLTGNSSTTMLTAPNSWYFLDSGIEFTAVLLKLACGSQRYSRCSSAISDINGFARSTLLITHRRLLAYCCGDDRRGAESAR